MKATLALFLLIFLLGCGNQTHVVPVVSASGPLPFPKIASTGGTIILEPGTYSCPASIPTSTHVIGRGAIVPPELTQSDIGPMSVIGAVSVVRVVCNHSLTIHDAADVNISGVVFDFQGTGGLILDSVLYSRFDIAIVNADTALTLTTTNGNTFSNTFPRLTLFKNNVGIMLKGINSKGVTWNDFSHVDIVKTAAAGIIVSQFADTNTFSAVRMHLLGSATDGVIFNDASALADVDASGNLFSSLSCDAEPGFTGACAHFKGYTVGNVVRMSFGIMSDANKTAFDNAFSTASNTIDKMQEQPKQP